MEHFRQTDVLHQRVSAVGRLGVRQAEGQTRLALLYQDGAAKIRMPVPSASAFEAVLINTAGGLTGGDRLAWEIDVGSGGSAIVTTQACEKIYRAASGKAEVACSLTVAQGGSLAWLPQETIVFDRSAFARTLDVTVAEGGSALILEATVFGRLAMDERVARAAFRDRWRVRYAGRLIHAEDFAIGPEPDATLSKTAVAGGGMAVATMLLVADDAARHLDAARDILEDAGGASFWQVGGTGKLLARLVAKDGYHLRKRLVPLVELLNGKAGLPKVWSL